MFSFDKLFFDKHGVQQKKYFEQAQKLHNRKELLSSAKLLEKKVDFEN